MTCFDQPAVDETKKRNQRRGYYRLKHRTLSFKKNRVPLRFPLFTTRQRKSSVIRTGITRALNEFPYSISFPGLTVNCSRVRTENQSRMQRPLALCELISTSPVRAAHKKSRVNKSDAALQFFFCGKRKLVNSVPPESIFVF